MIFPVINHINDIWPRINHKPEFYLSQKDGYQVINYMNPTSSTFDNPFALEGRGIMFDTNGYIIRRPYAKFFNVGEKEETFPQNINLSQPHKILQKLDGSMVASFWLDNEVRLGTKMGITDVSLQAEEYIKDKENYKDFLKKCDEYNITAIFEWCSRKNRIVIDYPEDALILTALRNLKSGWYYEYDQLLALADMYDLPLVEEYNGTLKNMEEILFHTAGLIGEEGYVIRFDDGAMMKIKADEYIRFHRAKDSISLEKHVLDLIFNDNLDDILPHLQEVDYTRLIDFNKKVMAAIDLRSKNIFKYVSDTENMFRDKKSYALWSKECVIQNNLAKFNDTMVFFFYGKSYTQSDVRMKIIEFIKKNLSSSSKIDNVRWMWNSHTWVYTNTQN